MAGRFVLPRKSAQGSGLAMAGPALGVWLALAAGPAFGQTEVTIVLPEAGGRHTARLEVPLGRVAQPPPDHHGSAIATLNELSPLNFEPFEWSRVKVKIISPWGDYPPYELGARVQNPPVPDSGDVRPSDVGVGVFKTNAHSVVINPLFDYDPRSVGKNVDGEPLFQGTLGDFSQTLPGTPFYETTRRHAGQIHQVWLDFAVAPQFYTPGATASITIELYVSRM